MNAYPHTPDPDEQEPLPREPYYHNPISDPLLSELYRVTSQLQHSSIQHDESPRSDFSINPTLPSSTMSTEAHSRSKSPASRPVPTYMVPTSPEARCITYLFQTTLKDARDMPLMTLMTFMNDGFEPQDHRSNYFTFEEVKDCVAELGRQQMLIFTQEGGVQLKECPIDYD